MVRENITKGDVQHLKRLLALKNPNLVPVWKMHNLDSHSPTVEIVSTVIATLGYNIGTLCNFLQFEIEFKLFH